MKKYTPDKITKLEPNQVFIFGSNAKGEHIGGAAKLALEKFGAVMGQAEGLQGQSYGFVTLNEKFEKVSLRTIRTNFKKLFKFATVNPGKEFLLTKVGCGIAGFEEKEVRDCFNSEDVPSNVLLPKDWIYKRLWKSLPEDMSPHGHKFEIGKWYFQDGEIEACRNGFHASNRLIDGMTYVECGYVGLVEVRGDHDEGNDKEAWQEMRIINTAKWNKIDSVRLAVFAAELVIEIYEKQYPEDKWPREAIEAAKKYISEPTNNNAKAAAAAAWAVEAAEAAAAKAAAAAAWAARAAAWAAAAKAAAWAAAAKAAAAAAGAAEAAAWAARAAAWAAEAAALDNIETWLMDYLRQEKGLSMDYLSY